MTFFSVSTDRPISLCSWVFNSETGTPLISKRRTCMDQVSGRSYKCWWRREHMSSPVIPFARFWECLLNFFKKNYVCGCFSLHACLYTVCTPGARGDKNKEFDPLELQLLMAVSWKWVLGSEPGVSGRAATAFNPSTWTCLSAKSPHGFVLHFQPASCSYSGLCKEISAWMLGWGWLRVVFKDKDSVASAT